MRFNFNIKLGFRNSVSGMWKKIQRGNPKVGAKIEFGNVEDSREYEAQFSSSSVYRGFFIRFCTHESLHNIKVEFLGYKH